MKPSLEKKLQHMESRFHVLGKTLSDPDITKDMKAFQKCAKERSDLSTVVEAYQAFKVCQQEKDQVLVLIDTASEKELVELAEQEQAELEEKAAQLETQIKMLLLPADPSDSHNVYLEIRAGTGGEEAAIFVGNLFTMYARYVDQRGWRMEIVSQSESSQGGFKEIIARVSGKGVYARLKFESGAHRVQRVPVTESQGRIHTSACTVAVLPEVEEVEAVEINPSELRWDTFRASGAGGQHVNKTDSAVRVTHIPTGVVVECQEERSQHKNRAKALRFLQSKLLNAEKSKQRQAQAQARRDLVGSGDRSERIRTYNFPQGRMTDHRIGLTLYKLMEVMEAGKLDEVIEPLIREYQADLLAAIDEE